MCIVGVDSHIDPLIILYDTIDMSIKLINGNLMNAYQKNIDKYVQIEHVKKVYGLMCEKRKKL